MYTLYTLLCRIPYPQQSSNINQRTALDQNTAHTVPTAPVYFCDTHLHLAEARVSGFEQEGGAQIGAEHDARDVASDAASSDVAEGAPHLPVRTDAAAERALREDAGQVWSKWRRHF